MHIRPETSGPTHEPAWLPLTIDSVPKVIISCNLMLKISIAHLL